MKLTTSPALPARIERRLNRLAKANAFQAIFGGQPGTAPAKVVEIYDKVLRCKTQRQLEEFARQGKWPFSLTEDAFDLEDLQVRLRLHAEWDLKLAHAAAKLAMGVA